MTELSQNCVSERYVACSNEIPSLNRDFFTRDLKPVDMDIYGRDFNTPTSKQKTPELVSDVCITH